MDGYESCLEMKFYLDTNVVVYFLFNRDELSADVMECLFDYGNILLTSTVCVQELIHLCQTGKLEENSGKRRNPVNPIGAIERIQEAGIQIIPVSERHLQQFSELPLMNDHRDPNDRLVIAQAISDRTALISSDHKFSLYEKNGLDFVFNER